MFTKAFAVLLTALLGMLALELVFGVRIGLLGWLHEQLTVGWQSVF